MLFCCFDRSQLTFAYGAHVSNDHFRVRMLIFVEVELVRKQGSLCPKLSSTDFFILELATADPDRVVVVTCVCRALKQRQSASSEGRSQQVAVKVQQEVLQRPTEQ